MTVTLGSSRIKSKCEVIYLYALLLMELSTSESLLILHEVVHKKLINIADGVVFNSSRAQKWLFTSKNGNVLRKSRDSLLTIASSLPTQIKQSLKKKYGIRLGLRSKIAKVWALVDFKVTERLVDEVQLALILKTARNCENVFLVQMYLEPTPYNGSGELIHEFTVDSHNNCRQITHEELEVQALPYGHLNREGENATIRCLPVIEELHEIVSQRSRQLVGWLQDHTKLRVVAVEFNFTLTRSGEPVLTGLSKLKLVSDVMTSPFNQRDSPRSEEPPVQSSSVKPRAVARPKSAVAGGQRQAALYEKTTESRRAQSDIFYIREAQDSFRRRPASAPLGRGPANAVTAPTTTLHPTEESSDWIQMATKGVDCAGDYCEVLSAGMDTDGNGFSKVSSEAVLLAIAHGYV